MEGGGGEGGVHKKYQAHEEIKYKSPKQKTSKAFPMMQISLLLNTFGDTWGKEEPPWLWKE